ncbi:hypothetical protein [Pseudogulbenkiania subflava]|uniref:Uncharacterized protein n=1 Tax=Pseudogulbenkiania subflava DSM 22618 TaxID=1123014 RepID=A0A1Y6C2W0_9NEIS|nr:hypothetical protein [Pseudogulbenkiania subflava]SMF43080.1 hypothetical protein SAMN02745746_03216 [Pseudogulbenkiania subflava DSM 22618]
MAAKPKKSTTANPSRDARLASEKRLARAEKACQSLMAAFTELENAGVLDAHDTARQYLQMCRVHYRKIRNGKVLGPADFNAAVDVCTSARRALLALDPALSFASFPTAEALCTILQQADVVLGDYQQLKTGSAKP